MEAVCFACLKEIDEGTEIVYLNNLYDEANGLTYGDCIEFCLNIILDKNVQNLVCNDCSLELEISYKFLKKVMRSQNILAEEEEYAQNDGNKIKKDDEVQLIQDEIQHEQETSDEISEYVITEDDEWNELNEDAAPQEVVITEQDVQLNNTDNEDIIEEVPCEEIEVYTNCSENEREASETLENENTVRRRRLGKSICDYCGKVFPNYSRMTAHRRCHEKPRATFNCVECGRMYASDQALSVHIRTAHKQEGFTCPICSKSFVVERSLEIHMRYHTRNFPYECKDCGKNFAQKGHLHTHQNVKHNGLRFICVHPNCNKLFTSSAALRAHEFSHGPMHPFECEMCKKAYPSKSKLKFHIRQSHNMDLSLDELEHMRLFYVRRSTPSTVIAAAEN